MRAYITRGGIPTWVNSREHRFLEDKFKVILIESVRNLHDSSCI